MKTSREIVFKHIRSYFPDDERWDTDKWFSEEEIRKAYKELIKYEDCVQLEIFMETLGLELDSEEVKEE